MQLVINSNLDFVEGNILSAVHYIPIDLFQTVLHPLGFKFCGIKAVKMGL